MNNYFDANFVRINLSTPFPTKSRCKRCGSYPSMYYYLMGKVLRHDPRSSINIKFSLLKKYCKRMCNDQYLLVAPKYFNELESFSHKTSYKGFLPKLHRVRGSNQYCSDFIEYLMCDCGATSWAFSNRSVQGRVEIMNRKARGKYPQIY